MTWDELYFTFVSSNMAISTFGDKLGWFYTVEFDIFSAQQTLHRRSVDNQLKEDVK